MGIQQMILAGAPVPVPFLADASYGDSVIDPNDASSQLTFNADGSLSHFSIDQGTVVIVGQWMTGIDATEAAKFELEVVITSGTAFNTSGTTAAGAGVWRSLGTPRMYGNDRTTVGGKITTATFTIRRISDSTVMDTASITISASVSL